MKAVGVGWSAGLELAVSRSNGEIDRPPAEATHKSGNPNRRRVLFAPTSLSGEIRYGPHHNIHGTEYSLRQMEIIRALARTPDVSVLVKVHPKDKSFNPLVKWVRQVGDSRIEVTSGGRLPATMRTVDLVVLDFPTTTLLEVMAMGKRLVYIHLDIMRWTSEGEALMRKTAPWVDANPGWEERLGEAVTKALEAPEPEPQANQFLQAYASLDFRPEMVWQALERLDVA